MVAGRPIVGAHIYLMAANTAGYGSASISLLDSNATGHTDATGAYVLTDAGGGFSITGDYSCTSAQEVYLLAVGGNPGSGNNSASALMAILGQCPAGSTNFLTAHPFISVNEVTTVAGTYALSGYMTDMLHVSSSGTALSNTGMANAFLTAAELADISTGTANATTPAGNGTVPQSKIDTLGNILAACINSDGTVAATPVPTSCYTLFANATSDGTSSGTQPTETVGAALNMAHNPGANVANLYSLQTPTSPFQPGVASITDLTLAIVLTGGGISSPQSVAVDAYGDTWTANYGSGPQQGSVSKFAAGTGVALSPASAGFTGGGIYQPQSVAIDLSNNVWLGDSGGSAAMPNAHLSKLASDGTPLSVTGYDLGLGTFVTWIAVDGSGNPRVFVAGVLDKVNGVTGSVTPLTSYQPIAGFAFALEPNGDTWVGDSNIAPGMYAFDQSGAQIFPSIPYAGPVTGLYAPVGVAIDHSGNVWVANGGAGNPAGAGVAEFSKNGTLLSPPGFSNLAGDDTPSVSNALAVDGDGHIFVAHKKFVSELNNDGSLAKTSAFYSDPSA